MCSPHLLKSQAEVPGSQSCVLLHLCICW